MLKNIKIIFKLMLCFGIVIGLSTIVVIVSILNIQKASNSTQNLYNRPYTDMHDMWAIRKDMVTVEKALYKAIATNDEIKTQKLIDENIAAAKSVIEEVERLKIAFSNNDKKLALINNIESLFKNSAAPIRKDINELILKGEKEKALEKIENEYEVVFNKTNEYIKELFELVNTNAIEFTDEAKKSSNDSILQSVSLLLLSLLISVLIIIILTKTLMKPINQMDIAINELSKGNLNVDIDYRADDELGSLAHNIRKTIRQLKEYIADINFVLQEIANKNMNVNVDSKFLGDFLPIKESLNTIIIFCNDMLYNTTSVANNVKKSSNEMTDISQSLAISSTNQSDYLNELVVSVEEINQFVSDTANNAQSVNNITQESVKIISVANEYMNKLLNAIDEITFQSQQISNIIKVIDGIAQQTNLLSLNASIEASRAGEHGAGFVIVASEMGKLANESSLAAKNTFDLIKKTIDVIENGSSLSNETATILEDVVNSSIEAGKLVNQISESCMKQSDFLNQISESIQHVSELGDTSSQTAQECSATSEKLLSQSELLMKMLKTYKLKPQNLVK